MLPMHTLPYRQIHLDFHTSPAIEGIGAAFDKKAWQETLKRGHVNSVTLFSKCHHGWSYHPTKVGKIHPHLNFDLLRAQFEAAKEIGVNAPIYLSAGVDNLIAEEHPEWREIGPDGSYSGWTRDLFKPGFHTLCFNTPYLDYLCEQIAEAAALFPEADGIFLDIISQSPCACRWCREGMLELGMDPASEEDRARYADQVMLRYYEKTTEAARLGNPAMPIYHNSGHFFRGRPDLLKYFSHLELESLPTGGWGYDHFPLSAKYAHMHDLDFLGMTGKFHTTWGEFGGYKHPNALRYECAAMLAYGAKCSVGDQLHPSGALDQSTYELIGQAYAEVEIKEPWCVGAENVAEIGLLSSNAFYGGYNRDEHVDIGASRLLLEGHFLFDVIDAGMAFAPYKLLILPDDVPVDSALKAKLDDYIEHGGRLLLSGISGLDTHSGKFLFDVGAEYAGVSEYQPDYALPRKDLRADWVNSPLVMYERSQRIKVTSGQSLGDVYDPYFNRTWDHFCSHQHTPARDEPSGYALGVTNGPITYLAHPVFKLYRVNGSVALRHFLDKVIRLALEDKPALSCSMPSSARVSLMHQEAQHRYVLHLLHGNTQVRGGAQALSGGTTMGHLQHFEVIEDLLPLDDVAVTLHGLPPLKKVTLEPQGMPLPFAQAGATVDLQVDRFTCHQMVVLHYA
jgi:hypothetical protein